MPTADTTIRAALWCFAATTLIFWLPVIRGPFDGPSYQWAMFRLGGQGIRGDYWFPILAIGIALAVRSGAGRRRRWAFGVITCWSIVVFAAMIALAASEPDGLRFRGDTLGIDVSLVWMGPLLFGTMAAVTLVATRRVCQSHGVVERPWRRRNAIWLMILVACVPIQFVLLRLGTIGSVLDQVGVVITIAQWLLAENVFEAKEASRGSTSGTRP